MPNVLGILKGSGSAIQLIKSLMTAGVPAEDVLSQVRAAGYDIIPSTANLAINYLKNAVLPANQLVASLDADVLPNLASIPLSLTKSLRNFSYLVKLTGNSMYGGQLEDRYISVSTNSLLTKEQAIDAAVSMSSQATKSGGLNNSTGEVQSISQNTAGLTDLDSIIPAPGPVFTSSTGPQKEALLANRNYLQIVASGPVTPIVFSLTGQIKSDDILGTLNAFINKYGQ